MRNQRKWKLRPFEKHVKVIYCTRVSNLKLSWTTREASNALEKSSMLMLCIFKIKLHVHEICKRKNHSQHQVLQMTVKRSWSNGMDGNIRKWPVRDRIIPWIDQWRGSVVYTSKSTLLWLNARSFPTHGSCWRLLVLYLLCPVRGRLAAYSTVWDTEKYEIKINWSAKKEQSNRNW